MSSTPHDSPSATDPAPSQSNRRQFLIGAAGGAALALPVAGMARGAQRPANPAPNWDQLGRTLKGNLLRPGDSGYDDVIKIRNLRYAGTHPAGVALVADAHDVATAIAWAGDNGVPMVSRSGGHSYAGYSTTPGLVINLKAMTGVTVDPTSGNMRVTGAATNQDVANAGKPFGRTIPGGQCPAVGVAGFVLGGGLGFYMRQHGLGIDTLLATEIVTADGSRRCVTVEELPKRELFWALCGGGGGNFGINTSFEFRTFVVPKRVMTFSFRWDAEDCVRGFLLFQEILRDAPHSLGAIAHFGTVWDQASGTTRTSLRVFGQVEGKKAAYKLLEPLGNTLPRETLIEERDFWAAKDYLAGTPSAPNAFTECLAVPHEAPARGGRRRPRGGLRTRPDRRAQSIGGVAVLRLGRIGRQGGPPRHRVHPPEGLLAPVLQLLLGDEASDGSAHRLAGQALQRDGRVFERPLVPELHRSRARTPAPGLLRREPPPPDPGQTAVRSAQRLQLPSEHPRVKG